jgi:hypothetical protein
MTASRRAGTDGGRDGRLLAGSVRPRASLQVAERQSAGLTPDNRGNPCLNAVHPLTALGDRCLRRRAAEPSLTVTHALDSGGG